MQTSETGSDTGSTVTLQTSVASQAAVPTQVVQQVPVQQQVQQVQTVQQVQHVYPAQVQYVEGSDTVYTNGAIRTTTYPYTETQMYSQNTGGNYFDTQGSSAQVTTVVSSHSMVGTGGIQMGVTGGQLISSSGGTYLIGNSMENSGHSVTHTTRASPATIEMAIETLQKSDGLSTHRSSLLNSHLQWLLDNYETAEGVSLPRSTLYNHYLRHCQEHKLDPVNAASFGKLIRSIFMGLRTRRLGTRGNSKYHYYGIRVKPDSPLNRLQEDMQYMAMRQQPMQQKQRYKPMQKVDGVADGFTGSGQQTGTSVEQTVIAQSQHHQQFLDASRALPEFGEVEISSLPDGTTFEDIKSLQSLYREHCEAILDVVVNLQFSLIEKLWQTFWRYSPSTPTDGTTITESSNLSEIESRLPKAKLITLCKHESILKWMCNCDHGMYQALVEILIPDVLRPIPSALTQAIRNFAKSLEGWLSNAMNNIPQRMIQTKVAAVSAFAQTLRRYTSLNHLAQAARAVLQNTSQINQMLNDLNRVDFANVQEQASWVCQCDDSMVQRLETDFKMTLQQQSTLEQWAAWLDNVMMQALKPYEGRPSFPKAARQFLLKWSFYRQDTSEGLECRLPVVMMLRPPPVMPASWDRSRSFTGITCQEEETSCSQPWSSHLGTSHSCREQRQKRAGVVLSAADRHYVSEGSDHRTYQTGCGHTGVVMVMSESRGFTYLYILHLLVFPQLFSFTRSENFRLFGVSAANDLGPQVSRHAQGHVVKFTAGSAAYAPYGHFLQQLSTCQHVGIWLPVYTACQLLDLTGSGLFGARVGCISRAVAGSGHGARAPGQAADPLFGDLNAVSPGNLDKDEGSEVESEMDEELDDSSEPQAKREKTELNQAFQVGCMQPVLESGVQPSLLNPIHSEHIVTSSQTIRQCSATGNTYTAV
ncbi:transcription factor RFX3 [Puma concolor]|uniref:Transcription factor RFX3 n=8 Tax=Boreoeutheria TaxID=1437010 RepID=A0A6P6IGF9_PUMCO|nr:transcription factor RFX3 [Puma concolor]